MLGFLLRNGVRRGLLGDSRFWTVAFVLAAGVRVLRWLGGRESDVVYSATLEPGHVLAISHLPEDRRGKVPPRVRKELAGG